MPMGWAAEEAQHRREPGEKALFDRLLPPESAPGFGRELCSAFQGPLHEPAFQRDSLLSGHLLAVLPGALGKEPGVLVSPRESSC